VGWRSEPLTSTEWKVSREAAEFISPGRKSWVVEKKKQVPQGRHKIQA